LSINDKFFKKISDLSSGADKFFATSKTLRYEDLISMMDSENEDDPEELSLE
jgi:hypothetical protein